MPALSLTRLFRVWRVTPRAVAACVTLNPSGSRQFLRMMPPGCGWFFMGISFFSMVINQIYIGCVAACEAKCNTPVAAHDDGPNSPLNTFKLVKAVSRDCQVVRSASSKARISATRLRKLGATRRTLPFWDISLRPLFWKLAITRLRCSETMITYQFATSCRKICRSTSRCRECVVPLGRNAPET